MAHDTYVGAINTGIAHEVKAYVGVNNLPSTYQRVEYLQVHKARIDTGYKPNNNTKVVCLFGNIVGTDYGAIFGVNDTNEHGLSVAWESGNFHCRFFSGDGSYVDTQSTHPESNKVLVSIESGRQDFTVNGVTETLSNTFASQQLIDNMYLFAINNVPGGNVWGTDQQTRMYYLRIYESGTIVRNFVPCYRKSDDEPGLYDTVNGEFYPNANPVEGRYFTVGSDINSVARISTRGYIGDQNGIARMIYSYM